MLLAAEKAAQYAASNAELEARVRVLEKIAPTADSKPPPKSALRTPRLGNGDKSSEPV